MWKSIAIRKLLLVLPVMIITTFIDVLISFCVAATVFFQLFVTYIANKETSLIMAIISAIIVSIYIRMNHKIHKFIISKENDKHE